MQISQNVHNGRLWTELLFSFKIKEERLAIVWMVTSTAST